MVARGRFYSPIPEGAFTRSRVARFTGLSDDVLAHWTKEGLLLPSNDASGAGQHKEFDYIEVQKAALLGNLRNFGCNLDALRWLSSIIDRGRAIAAATEFWPAHRLWELRTPLEFYRRLLAGERVMITDFSNPDHDIVPALTIDDCMQSLLWDWKNESVDQDRLRESLRRILERFNSELDAAACELMPDLVPERFLDTRTDSAFLVWRERNQWQIFCSSEASNLSGNDGNRPLAGIIVYVTRILRELWSVKSFHLDDSWQDRAIARRYLKSLGEKM